MSTSLYFALGGNHLAALFFPFALYPGVLEGVTEYRTAESHYRNVAVTKV